MIIYSVYYKQIVSFKNELYLWISGSKHVFIINVMFKFSKPNKPLKKYMDMSESFSMV